MDLTSHIVACAGLIGDLSALVGCFNRKFLPNYIFVKLKAGDQNTLQNVWTMPQTMCNSH